MSEHNHTEKEHSHEDEATEEDKKKSKKYDAFNLYGYGIIAFFKLQSTLIKVFTIITFFFAVPLIIHNSNAELTSVNDAFALFQTTVANLGASSVQKNIIPLSTTENLVF
jgi:hypothetical protein